MNKIRDVFLEGIEKNVKRCIVASTLSNMVDLLAP
jgi:hypothetical protein